MTKVSVIEVDLGESIDNIIMADITEITKANRQDIDAAVATAKLIQGAADRRKKESEAKDLLMEKLYGLLLTAFTNQSYVSSKEIMLAAEGGIANMISFAGRMRNYLKERGNEYRLVSCKRNKETAYYLAPFNAVPGGADADQAQPESPDCAPS